MAKFDLVVRGGTLADGTGGALYEADVAVSGGRIVAVGQVADAGREEIDAKGLLVTPGFVDVHTHYDGQAVWDQRLTPSSFHGVTTAVMGNCGVGFAPVRRADHDRLVELMEGVEDLPGVVLHEGLSWNWESFGDYLEVLAARRYDMDVAAQLPHAPLRVYVMGDRACRLEAATEADIAEMRRLTTEAMRAGAVGFATSRLLNHRSLRGDPIPSLRASEAELLGIALGMSDAGAGVMEVACDFGAAGHEGDFAMLRRVVAQSGRPLSFSLNQKNRDPEGWRRILDLVEDARAQNLPITAQVAPRPTGSIITLQGSTNPFLLSPTFKALSGKPLGEMAAALRDPAVRARVLAEAEPHRHGPEMGRFGGFERLFVQDGEIDYAPARETSIARRAAAEGLDPLAMLYDHFVKDGGRGVAYFPVNNYADFDLDAVLEMIQHPNTVIGLGDGGAHVGIIADASFPTYLLSHWARDRREGRLDLGWLVKRQTADSARLVGMTDRGALAPGQKADINVIDFDRLGLEAPVMTQDLPAGGSRLMQRARGYVATVVSGETVYRDGHATGALPGRLVRGPAACC
ncbi:N-acyl-D-amino-acid deacylase family protein [Phenylobacterium sp.]|jgi:N-acyl-D-aspartate/D-glutamate deacylase|uniref:N-acyl-D-amino-acid deacylase family protein n=1 Tax=Phenylobacterium sp. TaxID=1871053 RepID=UPI002F4043A0